MISIHVLLLPMPSVPVFLQIKWETAPQCASEPTLISAMPDAQGRLWGWENDDNCVFVHHENHEAITHSELVDTVAKSAASNQPR